MAYNIKKTWSVLSEIPNRNIQKLLLDKVIINSVVCCYKQTIAGNFNSCSLYLDN